ncbi:MAG: 2-C-methyl-D-erythritol 4-phosphate cytidylyltransferase [Lachnospiraceae bacterium]|nr:2-C-methyl-D-erythritol 4-phosphate cytidylyltransferase [Lachnospiraceae bacterium]
MRTFAIVLAGGRGSRMNSETPKQYMLLGEKPVIYYSLFAFEQNSRIDDVILVCAEDDIEYCKETIVERYHFSKVRKVVAGGNERYLSVYNALQCIEDADMVYIHDGARPNVTDEIIDRLYNETQKSGACVAAVPAKDTIKIASADAIVESTPDRNSLWQIQTPQVFYFKEIKEAYAKAIREKDTTLTDDAMVMECYGERPVKLVMGDYHNLKITTPEDMEIMELFLKKSIDIKKV